MPECESCDGEGYEYIECAHCNGSGEGQADGAQCIVCRGAGEVRVDCSECDGTGEVEYVDEDKGSEA